MDSTRHTCLRLELPAPGGGETIFIRGCWFRSHFALSLTDGLNAWICNASEEEVEERAEQWDQSISDYLQTAERYLGFRQPGSNYAFEDAQNGFKRLSWTFEKQGIKLEWRWKCKSSTQNRKTTAEILDFLMDANIRLSEEVVRKTQSFERLKVEAQKCLSQSEKFSSDKTEFESAIYGKFVAVLNSKKAKLRQLRDQLSNQEDAGKSPQEDVSSQRTESYDEETDNDKNGEEAVESRGAGTSKSRPAARQPGRKRKSHI